MPSFSLAVRYAFRELRSGLGGFRIFIACLALGVAAIAGAGSLNQAIQSGIEEDAQLLLGGDLQATMTYREINAEERTALEAAGDVSGQITMRSMARSIDISTGDTRERTLIELKAVDDLYPLYGAMGITPALPLSDVLAEKDGYWGTAVDPVLKTRLDIEIGDIIRVGEGDLQVRAFIDKEPDRVISFATAGPRVMVANGAMAATQLIQPGSLISYVYNVRVTPGVNPDDLRESLKVDFPDAGWRIRGLNQAARSLEVFLDNVTLFLTLVGLTALLTGGIGVANAARAYLDGRLTTIATLKCLGAPGGLIFSIYAIQLSVLSVIGIALGLVIGAGVPFLAANAIGGMLPVDARFGLYSAPLIKAAIFGVLSAAVFALWPLAKAREIPAVALFRQFLSDIRRWPRKRYMAGLIVLSLALGAFTIFTADRPSFAFFFVVGAAVSLVLFRFAATGVMNLAAKLSSKRGGMTAGRPTLRLAMANLYRPGNPTTSVVLSLGLGLSVLVCIALLESNLNAQINGELPEQAPSMFFIDIQPNQTEQFKATVEAQAGVDKVTLASMIRGRISQIDGVPTADANIAPDARWAVRGERGISTAAVKPENAKLVKGDWWAENNEDENFLSIDSRVAEGLGLDIGDTLTVNILGREITAEVANLRDIRWEDGTMNFALVFSPNALRGAPGMYIATVNSKEGTEEAIERAVVDQMPNVTIVQVREALEILEQVLGALGTAVRVTAAVAIVAGALVLAGAIAAGHARRIYESVVLKVLGATRADVLKAFVFEYCLLGLATGTIAAVVGSLSAWAVLVFVMKIDWILFPGIVGGVIVACIAVTLLAGFAGVWRALGIKAAPLLRND
ncbi:MAG: FtsX-like permease family protein [Rhodospirillaceae bacterium]